MAVLGMAVGAAAAQSSPRATPADVPLTVTPLAAEGGYSVQPSVAATSTEHGRVPVTAGLNVTELCFGSDEAPHLVSSSSCPGRKMGLALFRIAAQIPQPIRAREK